MTTKKSIYIWILFGILIIAAWLLGSVTQARAQTYTMKCLETGSMPKVNVIEVGDVPGHIIFTSELAGIQSCDNGSVATISHKAMGDVTKGSGKSQSYALVTYEDGSTLWQKVQNTVTANPDGKSARWEGTLEYIKGTGRLEGIQGGGTFIGKRLALLPGVGAQYYVDFTTTYTLPSK
jgi:hypothetical protein